MRWPARLLRRPLPLLLAAVLVLLVGAALVAATLVAVRSGAAAEARSPCTPEAARACVEQRPVTVSGPYAQRRAPGLAWRVEAPDGSPLGRVVVATTDGAALRTGPATVLVEPDGDVVAFVQPDGSLVLSRAVGWTDAGWSLGLAAVAGGAALGLVITALRQRRATGSWTALAGDVSFGSAWAAPLVVTGCVAVLLGRLEVPAPVSLAVLVLGLSVLGAGLAVRVVLALRHPRRARPAPPGPGMATR